MIGADELLGGAAELAAILGCAVPAAVLEHVDRTILGARDDDRRRPHVGADEIAGIGNLGLERHVVPGAAVEDALHLALVDILVRVDPIRYAREIVSRPHVLPREQDAVVAGARAGRATRQGLTIAVRLRSRSTTNLRLGQGLGRRRRRLLTHRAGALQINQHTSGFYLDCIGAQVLDGGFAQRLAGADVEARLMQGAFDLAVLHPTVGEQGLRVRALALGCVDGVPDAVERDRRAVDLDPDHLAIAERVRTRHLLPRHVGSPRRVSHLTSRPSARNEYRARSSIRGSQHLA